MKKKHVYVILKNKIIGTDSVITLCMQIYKECGYTFTFILFEHGSFKAIKNDNIVLFDAINSIGKLVSLSSERYKYRVISKIFTVLFFIKMILKIKFQENYIMHSGGLHVKPLSFIMNFTPLQRIIFHETSSYGRLCHENKGVDTPEMFFSRRQTQNAFDSNVLRHLLPTLNAGILIAYDEFWNYFKHPEAINAQQVVFNNSRNAGAWIDFIKNKSFDYIEKELYGNFSIQKNKHIIIIFIGRLQLDKSGKYIESFIHMINEIAKNVKNKLPIFIKPHIFSDLEFIEKCISKGVGDYNMKYIFTKLHPSVLASRATISFFIGDSNVIYEISNLNVPIVQCLYGFNDKEVAVKSSKKSDYIITKANPFLNDIISRIAFSKHTPVLYKKRRKELNCSFL